jgi:hypothetical protein
MLACNVGSRGWTPGISVLRTLSANFFRKLSFIRRTTYYLVYHKGRFALNFLGNYSLLSTLIDYPKLLRISTCYFNNHGGHIHISFRYIHLHGSSPSVSNVHSWNRRLQPRNHSGATVGPERARENQNLAVAKNPMYADSSVVSDIFCKLVVSGQLYSRRFKRHMLLWPRQIYTYKQW